MADKQDLDAIQKEMDDIEKRLEEQERLEEEGLQKFDEDFKTGMKDKLDSMKQNINIDVSSRFTNLDQRVEAHQKDNIGTVQTDVLRTNKIIRDVSRALGTQWKDVFVYLMAGMSKEWIDKEVASLEKERPFMQAYKALMRWKDVKSENFDFGQLIEALNIWDKQDLAKHVETILYSEGDALFKFQNLSSGSGGAAAAAGDKAASGAEGGEGAKPRPVLRTSQAPSAHPLSDTSLLRMSKKVGSDWLQLAQMLGVAEEDVEEIKSNEGMTYQGAFKVLWTWRDRSTEQSDVNHVTVLREALQACNLTEVIQLLPAES